MRKFLLVALFAGVTNSFYGQAFNGDPKKSFINIDMPKTPESQGIEKYGNTQVNENTGSPNISIPLFNLRSKFIEVPVSLSYNASGVRVDQEATSTGLGFDLIAGGRITVEIKGGLDDDRRWNVVPSTIFKPKFQRIVNRLNNGSGKSILTYATIAGPCGSNMDCSDADTMLDNIRTVEAMAWFGMGEPDIYHANFMGNSVSFYYDMVTDQLKWLGEKSLFSVSNNKDSIGRVINWIVSDNSGVAYYFYQREKTMMSGIPNSMGVGQYEATTAWLLTKILHPSGDSVNFSYTNYGKTYPATTPSASISAPEDYSSTTLSPDFPRDSAEQEPAYLTKIETNYASIDFILENREDLKGAGAKKVSEIKWKDKITTEVKRSVKFRYSYFTGTLETYHSSLPDSVTKYFKNRLRLDSLFINDSAISRPYRFYYHTPSGVSIPEKYSFSQDHWGYYNGRGNNSTYLSAGSPSNLIPTKYSLSLESIPVGFSSALDGYGDRRPSETHMSIMTMDSIVYPTGGSTKLIYEPHQTDYFGGGLRVKKTIDNSGVSTGIASMTEYHYEQGYYSGVLNYTKIMMEHKLTGWPGFSGVSMPQHRRYTISSVGAINYSSSPIGYAKVTRIQKTPDNSNTNGKVIKYYKPVSKTGYDCGIEKRAAHYPAGNYTWCNITSYYNNHSDWLYPDYSQLPGSISNIYDGKLTKEEFYDNNNVLLKSAEYFYSRTAYSQDIYSIKSFDNYENGVSYSANSGNCNGGYLINGDVGYTPPLLASGMRRYLLFATPAKSYFTLTDSIIEKTYQGSNVLVQMKAFKYNSYAQPEYTSSISSDGSQSIVYMQTPLSLQRPNIPSAGTDDSYLIEQMKSSHIYDVPIEQVLLKRSPSGDTTVTGAVYNVYEYGILQKAFALETASPLSFRTQFIPVWYHHNYPTLSSFYVIKDAAYKLQDSALYTTGKSVKDIFAKAGNKSFIWDETYHTPLAQCINAESGHIAYSSFETAATGNWTYSGAASTDASAPTGEKAYNLSGGNITRTGLSTGKSYIISCWVKSGASVTVAGGTILSTTTGRTFGNWTYKEYRVSNLSSLTISGSGSIDELRLYPDNALMTSYTYKPLTGVSSQNDPNNRIAYYIYDAQQRLILILDQDKNVLKKVCYNYAGRPEDCTSPCTNVIANWQNTETALRCQQGICGNTGYQEQEQRDMNTCSPTYNQTQWVPAGYNPTACTLGTGVIITYQNNINISGFTAVYTNIGTSQVYTFSIPTGSGTLGCIPAGNYNLTISKAGNSMMVLFACECRAASGTSATFGRIPVSTTGCNTVTLDYDY